MTQYNQFNPVRMVNSGNTTNADATMLPLLNPIIKLSAIICEYKQMLSVYPCVCLFI